MDPIRVISCGWLAKIYASFEGKPFKGTIHDPCNPSFLSEEKQLSDLFSCRCVILDILAIVAHRTRFMHGCIAVPHNSSAASIDLCTSLKTWFRKLHKPWISYLELLLPSDLQICARLRVPDVAFPCYLQSHVASTKNWFQDLSHTFTLVNV